MNGHNSSVLPSMVSTIRTLDNRNFLSFLCWSGLSSSQPRPGVGRRGRDEEWLGLYSVADADGTVTWASGRDDNDAYNPCPKIDLQQRGVTLSHWAERLEVGD